MANVLNYAKTGFGLALGFSALSLLSIVVSIIIALLVQPKDKNIDRM